MMTACPVAPGHVVPGHMVDGRRPQDRLSAREVGAILSKAIIFPSRIERQRRRVVRNCGAGVVCCAAID